jgi:DNA (cytosine-5)-methyltransferase 1
MRLLDLFCGAGGAAMGYHRAGFEVVGVDIKPQPHYPFEFHQADALEVLRRGQGDPIEMGQFPWAIGRFDAIHASPPCQAFCDLKSMYNALPHADLLTPIRALLLMNGLPYVIESVPGSPIRAGSLLCGTHFGLGTADGTAELRRHRYFEVHPPTLFLGAPCAHDRSKRVIGVYGGHGRDRRRIANTQDFSTEQRREAMGIDWMTGNELSQSIPPAYTEWIGRQLIEALR